MLNNLSSSKICNSHNPAHTSTDLFSRHLLFAGSNIGQQGACKGDSGGPLMYKDTGMP